jgi:two-component system sensor histidine kinase BaeS
MVLVIVLLAVSAVWLVSSLLGSSWAAVLAAILAVLLLAAVARGVRVATAPLGELIEASGRVEAGELGGQVPERGPREIRALARSFNAMSARLAATEEQRRRLLADVSHELRTPLTVLQGNVEAMLDGLYPADREHLERVRDEAQQLERLIDDLRTLSLADAGALTLNREEADLAELAREAVAGFEAQASAAQVALVAEADVPVELELDPHRVRQVITNLVANALRHTPAGGRVTVAVERRGEQAMLEVRDTGAGMPPEDVARAFDRFWRQGEGASAGLGLAIVQDLVAAHGGEATLTSQLGQGTTVTCRLPVGAASPPAGG